MKKSNKVSIIVFITLAMINSSFIYSLIKNQVSYQENKIDAISLQVEDKFQEVLKNLYHSIDMLEQITLEVYEENKPEKLDAIFSHVIEDYGYKNVSILPKGIVTYIYPIVGNEKAIGDNVLTMANRKHEANLAIETREVILSGPYDFTQGGNGFILRKAIFKNNEFWGFVAVVIDKEVLLEKININAIYASQYKHQFIAEVNNLDPIVVDESIKFMQEQAQWVKIKLPNGSWYFGIHDFDNIDTQIHLVIIAIFGYTVSLLVALYIKKLSIKLKFANQENYIDKLTGVNNRKLLEHLRSDFIMKNIEYAVFYLDLNNFKPINDTYGHDVGDEVLIKFAKKLKSIINDSDYIIRMGGDEFLVILPSITSKKNIENFCERLSEIQIIPILVGDINLALKFSYGFAVANNEMKNLQ